MARQNVFLDLGFPKHEGKSAIRFHLDTFGIESLESETPVLQAFLAEAVVA